jgi:hypothetical protein
MLSCIQFFQSCGLLLRCVKYSSFCAVQSCRLFGASTHIVSVQCKSMCPVVGAVKYCRGTLVQGIGSLCSVEACCLVDTCTYLEPSPCSMQACSLIFAPVMQSLFYVKGVSHEIQMS